MSPNKEPKETGLVPVVTGSNLPAEIQQEILAEMETTRKAAIANIDMRPIKIKIAPGGVNNFQFGTTDDLKPKFSGVMIGFIKTYAFWLKDDQTVNPVMLDLDESYNNKVPYCNSFDGITGSRFVQDAVNRSGLAVKVFGKCADCYLNKYGTAVSEQGRPGKGKACKNGRRIIVMPENSTFPHLFMVPPTSLRAFDDYIQALMNQNIIYWGIWTEFGLTQVDGGGGIRYSVLVPRKMKALAPDELAGIVQLRRQFAHILHEEITAEEFVGEEVKSDPDSSY